MNLVEQAFAWLGAQEEAGLPPAWARFQKAASLLNARDYAGVERECRAMLKDPAFAPAYALRAMAAAGQGRWEPAKKDLARAQALRPGRAWPSALLAAVLQTADDRPGARQALDQALALAPAASLFHESAKAFERLGMLPQAKRHAAEAIRLEPAAEHHRLLGDLQVRSRDYADAAASYGRVLRLAPGDGETLLERSKSLAAAGRIAAALRDAETLARRPEVGENVLLWRAQLAILAGKSAKTAMRGLRPGFSASFVRAYRELARKRYGSARGHLARCVTLAADPVDELRAGFYSAFADVLHEGRDDGGPARLYMVGLGIDPPHTATAEGLRALARCDVIYNNTQADNTEWLRLLCRDCRPISYKQEHDERSLAGPMLAELRRGRRVGFVTRGNAIVFGYLGPILMRLCDNEGIAWRCFPSLSSADSIEARYPSAGAPGSLVFDAVELMNALALETSVPATIFLTMHRIEPEAVCRRLKRAYGSARACLVFDHSIGQEPLRAKVGDLAALWGKLSPSAIIHVPAGRALARPAGSAARLQILAPGLDPARHALVGAVQAAARCDAVFAAAPDAKNTRSLSKTVRRGLAAGKTIGVEIAGAPLAANPPALQLIGEASRAGAGWNIAGGISAAGVAVSAAGVTLGTKVLGLQSYAAAAVSRLKLEPSWPLVLRFDAAAPEKIMNAARRKIARVFGDDAALLWCRSDGRTESARLDELFAPPRACVLYVAPKPRRALRQYPLMRSSHIASRK